jgi:hypothetical protein
VVVVDLCSEERLEAKGKPFVTYIFEKQKPQEKIEPLPTYSLASRVSRYVVGGG